MTIIDFGVQDPAIASPTFSNTLAGYVATSTSVYMPGGPRPNVKWTVDFKTGLTMNGSPPEGHLRCVRRDHPKLCFSGPRFRLDDKAPRQMASLPWSTG